MTPLLEVRGLVHEYGAASRWFGRGETLRAVDGVDLVLPERGTLALVGESGSGKTTIGRAVLRLVEPTAGTILFRGGDLRALPPRELRRRRRFMQMVFQDPATSLNPRMRVGETIVEPLVVHGLVTRGERAAKAAELLREVGLEPEAADRFPHAFSGGQRQRIGIARALATRPALLVADEPVSALDVSVRAQVVNLLVELQQRHGIAMLFIAHDLALVEHVADRVAVLYLGRVVEEGSAQQVLGRSLHPYTRCLLDVVPVPDPSLRRARTALAGEPPSPSRPPSGCRFHPRCPIAKSVCAERDPALTEQAPEHRVACHFPGEFQGLRAQPVERNFSVRST